MSNPPMNLGEPAAGQAERPMMSGGVRIGLRLLGLLMLVLGLAFAGAFVVAGPSQMAEWQGQTCAQDAQGLERTAESCTTMDVIQWVPAAGILILVGAVLVLALRPARRAREPRPSLLSRAVARLYARGAGVSQLGGGR